MFMLVSWTGVLGTMFWAFARILQAQSRSAATPDPSDDRQAGRVPPTA